MTFRDNIVFQFYSKSVDKPPGMGAGEMIPSNDRDLFTPLSKIPNWRMKLSNFWISPFTLDGLEWQSVEHYYQGSKFKKSHPEFYRLFSSSGYDQAKKDAMFPYVPNDIATNPVVAKSAGGVTGKYKGSKIRDKSIKLDPAFFESGVSKVEMKKAQLAKYTQNTDLREMLLNTRDAKLVHYVRGSDPIVFHDTMEIRDTFRADEEEEEADEEEEAEEEEAR